jgi:hypothetical protein
MMALWRVWLTGVNALGLLEDRLSPPVLPCKWGMYTYDSGMRRSFTEQVHDAFLSFWATAILSQPDIGHDTFVNLVRSHSDIWF